MRHWFIGDSVIVRYGDDGKVRVRVTPQWVGEVREYRVSLLHVDGAEITHKVRIDLANALRLGQEWLP